ncbi:MAG: hypothetical protein SGPRY_007162, partial [Prymnesium sp.]
HQALIRALQTELGSPLLPPDDSLDWPAPMLRRWFTDGGEISMRALAEEPHTRRLIDRVGASYPIAWLPVESTGSSLLSMLSRGDEQGLEALAMRLEERGSVLCKMGVEEALPAFPRLHAALAREGEAAWERMRPGELRGNDGTVISARSPSGALRGDRYILARE